jgi:hypothetical protein
MTTITPVRAPDVEVVHASSDANSEPNDGWPVWGDKFIDALKASRSVGGAARAASVTRQCAYLWREKVASFAAAWRDAVTTKKANARNARELARRSRFVRAVGKTSAMAFTIGYLREHPGADYHVVSKAALSRGLPAPHSVVYGNAQRLLRKERDRSIDLTPTAPPEQPCRRRSLARGLQTLSDIIKQMETVIAERDRLRNAVEGIAAVVRSLRG